MKLLLAALCAMLATSAVALPYIPPDVPPIVGYIGPVTPLCLVGGVYRANAGQPDITIDGANLYASGVRLDFVKETLPSGLISWRTTLPQTYCDGQVHRLEVTVWVNDAVNPPGSRLPLDNSNAFFRQPFASLR